MCAHVYMYACITVSMCMCLCMHELGNMPVRAPLSP